MRYLKTHKDFVRDIDKVFDLNTSDNEFIKIDEAFENNVTLSNSLIGQLFGWVFRKIGGIIQKGMMGKLLTKLNSEFDIGYYSAIRNKEITKKNLLYSTIVSIKNMVKDDDVSDVDFGKKFPKLLKSSIETIRDLIEGKGKVRISDENTELIKIAKNFYDKLSELYGKKVELSKTVDDISKNEKDEKELVDESIVLNAPTRFIEQLSILKNDSDKIDIIAFNIESQLNRDVMCMNNLIKIDGVKNSDFKELDSYFKSINISIEMINDTILIDNYNRFEYLLEYSNNGNYEFIYDLNDDISYILDAKTPTGNVRGVGISKESDYEEKGESVYTTIFNVINKKNINFKKYIKMVDNTDDKNLIKGLEAIIKYLNKFTHSKNDATGFKNNYTNLIKSLEFTENSLSSIIDEIGSDESGRIFPDDIEEREELDNSNIKEINNNKWLKVQSIKYKINGKIKEARPNPNPPTNLQFDRLSVIGKNGGSPFSISGDSVVEMDGEETPNGVLNRSQRDKQSEIKKEKSALSTWLDDSKWMYDKKIEYNKKIKGEMIKSTAMVLDKSTQADMITKVGDIAVRYSAGNKGVLPDIYSKLVSIDGIPYNKKQKSSNRDYVSSVINNLMPDDELYERELILNERERKDLLNDIKHKVDNKDTLINPISVMKIFNDAHYKYTIDNFDSIPDGSQGSTLQGKGRGVNKRKNYKKMPDGSGRNSKLFKQWNDGVLKLLEEYNEYIPGGLKKFIIELLDNNKLYGNVGTQAKLLGSYFNIKVDIDELGIGKDNNRKSSDNKKSDIYVDTNDTIGEFKEPKSGSLQMKKENFKNVPFVLTGNQKGNAVTTYVCYYKGTSNGLLLFKFKPNNMDFLNNYKRSDQKIKEIEYAGSPSSEVFYGAIKIPKGGNKEFKPNEDFTMWFTDVKLEDDINSGTFRSDAVSYLQGVNDGGVMRLDARTPGDNYGDFQHKDFKIVMKKFSNLTV